MAQETTHVEAVIADLEAWRDRIGGAIETLRHLQSSGGGLPAGAPSPTVGRPLSPTDIPHDAFFQMTVPDAAEKYLGLIKKTSPNTELATALLKGGLKSSSQNFAEMVRTVMARDNRFVKVNSEWGLSTWYPGMGKGRKTKPERPAENKSTPPKPSSQKAESEDGSIGARALKLLESNPNKTFSAPEIAEAIQASRDSVAASLTPLLQQEKITRPERGKYQFKKAA